MAQHSGSSGSGSSGSGSSGGSHSDSGTDHGDSGSKGSKGGKGSGSAAHGSGGGKSLDSILRDVADDSDKPAWAGMKGGKNDRGTKPSAAGTKKGTLLGDMYVILRDANGVPILNSQGFVQPIDANNNLVPLDAEGAPIDPTLAQAVELSRLNVARSPDKVLDRRASEVVTMLNSATAITLDPAGRLVFTVDGVAKTIDSPLENLAIYVALMTQGTIPGVTDLPGTEYDHLVDGKLTVADIESAAAFLAGATDKSSPLTKDAIAYTNAILGIDTVQQGDVTYSNVDYSGVSYDRSDTYGTTTANVLVKQPDGSLVPTRVNIYEAVFSSKDFSASGTFDAFAKSAEDARADRKSVV